MAHQIPGLLVVAVVLSVVGCKIVVRADEIEELDVAAFNVQVFGTTKVGKSDVVDTLTKIIQRYDIIVIQEIRDSSETAIYRLQTEVNAVSSHPYSLEVGPRLGRSTSKEQYGFLYRPDKVTITGSYTYNDTGDVFEREPFVVRFNSPKTVLDDFAMVVIHTKPTDAVNEIDKLVDVYDDINQRWNLEDVVILGDFNAGCDYVDDDDWQNIRLRTDDRFTWLIDDRTDTTVANTYCAYDRIVHAGAGMSAGIWPDSANVFYFDQAYGLTDEQTSDVSDHYPVAFKLLPKLNEELTSGIKIQGSFKVFDDHHTSTLKDVAEFTASRSQYAYQIKEWKNSTGDLVKLVAWQQVPSRHGVKTEVEILKANYSLISDGQYNVIMENLQTGFSHVISHSLASIVDTDAWYIEITCDLCDEVTCSIGIFSSYYDIGQWSNGSTNEQLICDGSAVSSSYRANVTFQLFNASIFVVFMSSFMY